MSLQPFKDYDQTEIKVRDAVLPTLNLIGGQLDLFFQDFENAQPLGGVLWDTQRAPLTPALPRDVFMASFAAIFNLFTRPGTFEYYLQVFRKIWGIDVAIEFIVPGPGKLQINIHAAVTDVVLFVARRLDGLDYVFDEVITQSGDNIVFQILKGLKTQSEVDALMKELKPHGIYIETTLTIV